MSEQIGSLTHAPAAPGAGTPTPADDVDQVLDESSTTGADAADGDGSGVRAADTGSAPQPGDPADRELAAVADAMAQVRAGVPGPGGTPSVPADDEVAGLEQAHEALRSTLDRVDRGG